MIQLKMRVIDKAIPWSNPNKENLKKIKKVFLKCYRCFEIMILNLWSEDQEGPVKIYTEVRRSVLKIFINIACKLI